jgi:hypothetical protein
MGMGAQRTERKWEGGTKRRDLSDFLRILLPPSSGWKSLLPRISRYVITEVNFSCSFIRTKALTFVRIELKTTNVKVTLTDNCLPLTIWRINVSWTLLKEMDRDSCSVGIWSRYGLDGPGIESKWERDFSIPSIPVLGSTQPPVQWVPGLLPGDEAAGAWH